MIKRRKFFSAKSTKELIKEMSDIPKKIKFIKENLVAFGTDHVEVDLLEVNFI